ncbi:hypothetical protein KIN20_029247 [Parelaphostrongylus tenuis]|uniref:Uncharacterized protein n=1 Tax=Parelaphostrongylus tenuis TaxID=148309 RepID=A0AAD5R2D8_PARTN|nr:hypothetical protein KIN20_029247 [Parelaphostrongylus tenuis]
MDVHHVQHEKELLQYRGKRPDGTWCTDESNISSLHPEEIELSDWTTSHFHSDSEHVMFEMDSSVDKEVNVRRDPDKKELLQYRGKRPDGTWFTDESSGGSSRPGENEVPSEFSKFIAVVIV